eukprot:gene34462-13024_t
MTTMPCSPMHLKDRRTGDKDDEVNILIVEDVFLIQKVVAKMFRSILDPASKINIKCVSDGEDAIDACKET